MADVIPPDPDRPNMEAWPRGYGGEAPAAPGQPEVLPPAAPLPPPRRGGPLGLGWPWWAAIGCGTLFSVCCMCTLLAALVWSVGRTPTPPAPASAPAAPATAATATPQPPAAVVPAAPQAEPNGPSGNNRFGSNPAGSVAADFTLTTLDGQNVKLSDFRGRPVVLNFWASWCGPCKAEMPLLSRTHEEEKDGGLVIIGVDVQEPVGTVKRYVEENKLPFLILLDTRGEVSNFYRVRALPTTYFIDADGVVQAWYVGTLSHSALAKLLDKIRVR